MPTKISRYCEGLMEVAWLAAAILVPVFFDIYSSRIFEPDKIAILRSLALLILAAWLVKLVDEGKVRWERFEREESLFKTLVRTPLLIPVFLLAVAYIISTIFSVTPLTSLVGSYQRLQGTYTTFSYIVIFAAILGTLRKREQVDRLITTIIVASLPVSLYGYLQRAKLDPVPWGGDVSTRIASNMGNSIFVAAYLIMVVPLTIGRIVDSFGAIMREETRLWAHVARATVYIFTLTMQLLAIYWSGSRGPALGLFAGGFFLILLLTFLWRKRWITVGFIGLAAIAAIFLLLLNIPNGPLERIRNSSLVGRFGQILNTESNNALVRKYIWIGAANLVAPHAPLQYPNGSSDTFNFLRPLIGYGPESMYVAYNPFYVPDLGHVEKRNASPDRSHNETWDSLVITGVLGFVAYVALFVSVMYFGLKWMKFIQTNRQTITFFIFTFGGGIIGAVLMMLWNGNEFFGVGLPFGMAIGMLIYLTLLVSFSSYENTLTQNQSQRILTLGILFAAILGHFLEINFGIAIAVTRTYFWTYSALIFVVGYLLPKFSQAEASLSALSQEPNGKTPAAQGARAGRNAGGRAQRSRRRRSERASAGLGIKWPAWLTYTIVPSLVIGLLLLTLGFDFISNPNRFTNALSIVSTSLTRLPDSGNPVSLGIFVLFFVTWLFSAVVFISEEPALAEMLPWLKAFVTVLGASFVIGLIFWLLHAGVLASLAGSQPQTTNDLLAEVGVVGGLLTNYYVYVFLILLAGAFFLARQEVARINKGSGLAIMLVPFVLVGLFLLSYLTNLRVIQADVTFKMADPFTQGDQWPVATDLYIHAIQQAPNEDYYYLFLGRSYLEQAKLLTSDTDILNLVHTAESDLKKAQSLNPLNTDHTANLARLYSWWATKATQPSDKQQRAQTASQYYATALTLSPHNSTLWDEWAVLFMQGLNQPDQAYTRLQRALALDPEYSLTLGELGDYYAMIANSATDATEKSNDFAQAESYYQKAVDAAKSDETSTKISNLISLGSLYLQLSASAPAGSSSKPDPTLLQKSTDALQQAIDAGPTQSDLLHLQEQIAKNYYLLGDKVNALSHAQAALTAANTDALKTEVNQIISQIQAMP